MHRWDKPGGSERLAWVSGFRCWQLDYLPIYYSQPSEHSYSGRHLLRETSIHLPYARRALAAFPFILSSSVQDTDKGNMYSVLPHG